MVSLNLIMRTASNSNPTPPSAGSPPPIAAGVGKTSELYGWSRSEIYRLLASGKLKAVKSGRITLILIESADRYLASLPPATFRAPKIAGR
jgi:hypothetical protein